MDGVLASLPALPAEYLNSRLPSDTESTTSGLKNAETTAVQMSSACRWAPSFGR